MKNVTGGSEPTGGGEGRSLCCCGMGPTVLCEEDRDLNWVADFCPDGVGGCFF